ncbi:MAG: biotin/lipoyl-containing protein [Candidatus Competibacter sp.]
MSIIKEIHVPDIGDFKNVDVIEVTVAVGDIIDVDTPLIMLESDKATMEVPSPLARRGPGNQGQGGRQSLTG